MHDLDRPARTDERAREHVRARMRATMERRRADRSRDYQRRGLGILATGYYPHFYEAAHATEPDPCVVATIEVLTQAHGDVDALLARG